MPFNKGEAVVPDSMSAEGRGECIKPLKPEETTEEDDKRIEEVLKEN